MFWVVDFETGEILVENMSDRAAAVDWINRNLKNRMWSLKEEREPTDEFPGLLVILTEQKRATIYYAW